MVTTKKNAKKNQERVDVVFKWSNKSLTFKYGSVFVLTVLLFVFSVLLINRLLSDTRNEVEIMNESVENSVKLFEMEKLILERYAILGQHIVSPTEHTVNDFENSVNSFNSLLEELEPYIDTDEKQFLLHTAVENDLEIIEGFNEYIKLRADETNRNINRRTLDLARRNYQQSSFSLNQLRNIFEEERQEAVASTYESFQSTTEILVISILISVIVGIVVLTIVSIGVKKQLSRILSFSEKIEHGNLTTNKLVINGKDEFSKISKSLNHMKDGIENILKDVHFVSNNISQRSGDLEESATCLQQVSRTVSDRLSKLITIVEEQSASIITISDTNDSFNERINSIEQFSVKMKESSLDVSSDTKEGISLMNNTVTNIAAINQSVANSVSKVNVLVERAGNITQITELINKIAEKTNLLALNASIEAARAGEYGKGFAVVAEEIRKLSAEVNQSISDINVIIQGIHGEANEVKSVLTSSNEKTIEEQNKIEKNISNLKKIESSVNELVDHIDNIYNNLTTMTAESDEINFSLDGLSDLSNKTTDYINEANESIFEQTNTITEINNHSNYLYDSVAKLESSMHRFTVDRTDGHIIDHNNSKIESDDNADHTLEEPKDASNDQVNISHENNHVAASNDERMSLEQQGE